MHVCVSIPHGAFLSGAFCHVKHVMQCQPANADAAAGMFVTGHCAALPCTACNMQELPTNPKACCSAEGKLAQPKTVCRWGGGPGGGGTLVQGPGGGSGHTAAHPSYWWEGGGRDGGRGVTNDGATQNCLQAGHILCLMDAEKGRGGGGVRADDFCRQWYFSSSPFAFQ